MISFLNNDKQLLPDVARQVRELKEHLLSSEKNQWYKSKYFTFYVSGEDNHIEQFGVTSVGRVAHVNDYLSTFIADFKFFRQREEPYVIQNIKCRFNGPIISAEEAPCVVIHLKSGEIRVLRYNALYEEDEISSTIALYETLENKIDKNTKKITGKLDTILHINIDGNEIRRIKNYINYDFIEDSLVYIWYSFPCDDNNKFKIFIVNIKTGATYLFGETNIIDHHRASPGNMYWHITQHFQETLQHSQQWQQHNKLPQNVRFLFSQIVSINFDVFFYFVEKNFHPKIIDNICDDDPNKNYEVNVPLTDKKGLSFISYMLNEGKINGVQVFDYPLASFYRYLTHSYEIERFLVELGEEESARYRIVKRLIENSNCISVPEIVILLEERYGVLDLLGMSEIEQFSLNSRGNHFIDYSLYEVLFAETLSEITSKGLLSVRWKNEYKLFQIIQHYFKDAIFQYKQEWLAHQSLDIFVPSLGLGVEYQGQQHYEEIEYFGGIQQFEKQKDRDKKKERLCKENNVQLIYWPYTKAVTSENVDHLLISRGIKSFSIDKKE